MTKKSKVIFSLLFSLIMVFQLAAPIASAAPIENTDYALKPSIAAELTPEQILALDSEAEDTGNKIVEVIDVQAIESLNSFKVMLGERDLAEGISFKLFLEGDEAINITVPEGYYVSALYIKSDGYTGDPNASLLPVATADASSANLSLDPKDFLDAEGNLDASLINTDGSGSDSFSLGIVLRLIDAENGVSIKDANGAVLDGSTIPAAPELGENQVFIGWLLNYKGNGTSVLVAPGQEINPYADCYLTPVIDTVEPEIPEVETYVISATVKEGMQLEVGQPLPDDFVVITDLPEGIVLEGAFSYSLIDCEDNEFNPTVSDAGSYRVRIIADGIKVLKDGEELSPDKYSFNLTEGSVEFYAVDYPINVSLKAEAPVADGDSFKANGYIAPTEGLKDGDSLNDEMSSFNYEVKYEGEGADRKAYVVMSGEAKFVNADGEKVLDKYTVSFAESERIAAPVEVKPEIVELSITAKAPVYNKETKNFDLPEAPVYVGAEGLKDEDRINDETVKAEVKKDADGKYYTEISSVEILDKDGNKVDVSAKYNITFVASERVEAPAKEAILVTVTAKAPVYNTEAKKFEPADPFYTYTGTEGKDVIDNSSVKYEIVEEADGAYLKISEAKVVDNKGNAIEDGKYSFKFVDSEKTPLPKEPIKVVITANDPVLGSDGKTFETNGFTFSGLEKGDEFKSDSVKLEIKKTDDEKSVFVRPSGGVVVNGKNEVPSDKYSFEYKDSASVVIPVPDKDERGEITIKPIDVSVKYDGKEHKADNSKCTITKGHLLSDDTIVKLEISGSQTDAGKSVSEITKLVIKDSDGKDVTKDYDITYENGEIVVEKIPAVFTAITATVSRKDGDNQTIYASKLQHTDGSFKGGYEVEGLISGHKVSKIIVNGSGSEPGSSFTSSVDKDSIEILDGNRDVTKNYDISTVDGKVTLSKNVKPGEKDIPLTITAKDGTWTYDGNEHSILEYTATGLQDGDKISKVTFKNSSKITNASTAENVIESVTIVDKNGNSVDSGKYKVTLKKGTLTVNKYNLTVTAESASKKYDGKALENNNVSIGKLANKNHKVAVEYTIYTSKDKLLKTPPVEVGTYTKKITTVVITDANKNDVTSNYNIKKVDGTLTIKSSDKNNSTGPKTGDESNLGLWVTLLGVSAAVVIAVVVVIVLKNKKKAQEDEIQDLPEDEAGSDFNINIEEFTDTADSENTDPEDHDDKE